LAVRNRWLKERLRKDWGLAIHKVSDNVRPNQILNGVEKSGEQVGVHVNRKGELLSVMTIKTADIPETLSPDHEFEARYTEYLKDLKTGEALIMMTTEGSNHVGIYKLPPRSLH
jgi:hypothetical protein